MKTRLLCGAAIAALLAGSSAFAADLGVPMTAPIPPPVFSWTGCHLGTNGGLGTGQNQWTDTVPDGNIDGSGATRTANSTMTGGFFGGQVGCDYQFNGNWVIGVAGMVNWSDFTGTNQDQFNAPWTLSDHIDWYGSVTGRLGWTVNTILLYARAGAAFAHNNFEIENSGVTLGTPSDVRVGWTIGTGLEWAFSPRVSVFIEGNYYGFPAATETFNNPAAVAGGFVLPPFTINVKPSFETINVGINYRFGGGPLF
jgi:outer membrane immunogenic protein